MITLDQAQIKIGYGSLSGQRPMASVERNMWLFNHAHPIIQQFKDQPLTHSMLKNQAQARLDETPYTNRSGD